MFVEILLCARVCGEGGTPLKARKQTISPPGRQAYPRFPHAFVGSRSGMGDLPGQVETCSRLGSSKHPNTNGVYVTTVQRALAGVSRPIHFLFFFCPGTSRSIDVFCLRSQHSRCWGIPRSVVGPFPIRNTVCSTRYMVSWYEFVCLP